MTLRFHPDLDTFVGLAERWPLVPIWAELLADVTTPVGVFPALAGGGPGVLLESVERSERWGRFSFVGGDPAAVVVVDDAGLRIEAVARPLPLPELATGRSALEDLKALAAGLRAPRLEALPAPAGGLVGYLAYESARLFGGLPHPTGGGDLAGPGICFQVIDRAAVFDHRRGRLFLVAHVPGGGARAYRRGVEAVEGLADAVGSSPAPSPLPAPEEEPVTPGIPNMSDRRYVPNMSDRRYREIVLRIKEHVAAGEVFQVVPSRRLSFPAPGGALAVYRRLRVTNPSPYMFFLRMPGVELAGSSPEPLVRVDGRKVSTRPIAGTRPRGRDDEEDHRLELELLADPKERAEHAMLVDLARNDLGRVCRPGSVRPVQLATVERFSRVMHIVSTVEGELADGLEPLDALAASFPAGTVTGAPKRRAMEIIAEEEPDARGPYAGAAGYLSFAGGLDFCITIRTAVLRDGLAHVQVGAGVVADSDPERELLETGAKASALAAALVERGVE